MPSRTLGSIRTKLFFAIITIVVGFSTVLSLQIISKYSAGIKAALLGQKRAVAISVRSQIKNQLNFFHIDELSGVETILKNVYLENVDISYIYVSSNTGVLLYRYDPNESIKGERVANFSSLKDTIRFEIDFEYTESKNHYEAIAPILQNGQFVGRIHVGTLNLTIDDKISEMISSVAYLVLLVLLVSIPIFYLFISKIVIAPLNALSTQVRMIASNKDFTSQIDLRSSIEFETIAKDFNYMNASLKNYYADIESLNRNLENIVKKRTDELVESSNDLKKQNKTLEETLFLNEKMQKILIQQEKLASLGEVVAGIAHEINNPLNFVINGVIMAQKSFESIKNVLPDNLEISKQIKGIDTALVMVNKNGYRASSIVKNMLTHARGAEGKREVVNIKNIIDEYLKLSMHSSKGRGGIRSISIEKSYALNIPLISVVKQDIERVLLNIFTNSLYALDLKKELGIDNYIPTLTVKVSYGDGKLFLRIHDNGTGIRKEVLSKIFDPFFTTKPTGEGTGLGMSMCHDIIVNGHGGEIKVESEDGLYTEFEIVLPI